MKLSEDQVKELVVALWPWNKSARPVWTEAQAKAIQPLLDEWIEKFEHEAYLRGLERGHFEMEKRLEFWLQSWEPKLDPGTLASLIAAIAHNPFALPDKEKDDGP